MGKVSTLANTLSNPVGTDLIEVSHETSPGSGVWTSYKMTLETLNTFIGLGTFRVSELTFTEADIIEYFPFLNEFIQLIAFIPITATTIKVGTLTEPEYYVAETTDKYLPINKGCDEALTADRNINIALNGSGTVKIISILI